VQEIIANMLRHAGATRIGVGLSSRKEWLLIWLEDNGRGFGQESFERLKNVPGGLGLKNIQSRVDILQANLNFTVREDGPPGTRITLRVPVHA
jgi:signal transduction histidine kinase